MSYLFVFVLAVGILFLFVPSKNKVVYLTTTVKSHEKRRGFELYKCKVVLFGDTKKETYVVERDDKGLVVFRRPDLELVKGSELDKFLEGRAKWHKDKFDEASRERIKDKLAS